MLPYFLLQGETVFFRFWTFHLRHGAKEAQAIALASQGGRVARGEAAGGEEGLARLVLPRPLARLRLLLVPPSLHLHSRAVDARALRNAPKRARLDEAGRSTRSARS